MILNFASRSDDARDAAFVDYVKHRRRIPRTGEGRGGWEGRGDGGRGGEDQQGDRGREEGGWEGRYFGVGLRGVLFA